MTFQRVFAVTLISFLALGSKAEDLTCSQNLHEPMKIGEIIKAIEVNQSNDMTKFCNNQMLERMVENDHFSRLHKKALTTQKKDGVEIYRPDLSPLFLAASGQESIDSLVDSYAMGAWDLSMLPSLKGRKQHFESALSGESGFYKTRGSIEERLKSECTTCPRIFQQTPFRWDLADLDKREVDSRVENVLGQSAMMLKVCSDISVNSAAQCALASKKNLEEMRPPKEFGVVLPNLYKEFFSSAKYAPAMRKFALGLMQKAKSDQPVSGDMFSDLKASFQQTGFNATEADDLAWKVMALWSSGGVNVAIRISTLKVAPDASQTADAFVLAALTLPLVDFKSQARGQTYSFPSNVKNGCDNGKAYHFWMAAYLARERAKEKIDPKAAAVAAFVAQKGYQLAGYSSGGRLVSNVLAYNSFNPVHNVVRMDLNYAAAGAAFGVAAATGRSIQLDANQGYQEMLKRGPVLDGRRAVTPTKDMTMAEKYEAYRRWHQVFDPDPTFKQYIKSAGY